MVNKLYKCPRCGYTTFQKTDIKRHLYKRKYLCPGQETDIELTDEVKENVLKNRIYSPPMKGEHSTIIYNYHNVNNFIAGMDAIEKLEKYMKHKNMAILGFEQCVEDRYAKTMRRLDNDTWKYGYELNKDDILEVIDQISKVQVNVDKVKTFEDLNVYYDKNVDKLRIFDGEWEEMLTNKGIKKILDTIKSYYLDSYECFLYRKIIKIDNCLSKQRIKELLIEYYKFIGCFDVEPFIKNTEDKDIGIDEHIFDNSDDDGGFTICDEYYPLYLKTRDNIKKSEINNLKKGVLDIIRKNSDRNISELNKKLFDLFTMDEGFKNSFIPYMN